jgi:hypothetical protein
VPFEVITTDANSFTSSREFWTTPHLRRIPPTPSSNRRPSKGIQQFREEFGLDLNLKGNERLIAERIFNLIDARHETNTSEGQVARASMALWVSPLRAADLAEMEYRERYAGDDRPRRQGPRSTHGVMMLNEPSTSSPLALLIDTRNTPGLSVTTSAEVDFNSPTVVTSAICTGLPTNSTK